MMERYLDVSRTQEVLLHDLSSLVVYHLLGKTTSREVKNNIIVDENERRVVRIM